ncbi:uncharacterized protein PV09_08617 [Verruconis gallopava]|uniref:FAD-binding PCMH-type domain-containing protein n=1 Tax=Verruconis gallopava TaxID=253628 RepID=A0A0D2AL67_9PEZI|nr:uncharacterized protein PV09_08617 [Verruconis gallopava]KIV99813.1 hypothetical protein PV09_08617 [Verruconis gallopava]
MNSTNLISSEPQAAKSSSVVFEEDVERSTPVKACPIIWKDSVSAEEYEKARIGRVFNSRHPKRYPVAVVEAESVDHVVEAVRLAKSKGHRVSIRSGGHSWAVWSVRDDAVLIDLHKLKEITFEDETGIVKVSPSTTGRILNGFLGEKGRMFPGGHCPDVGLGGFLLQGGMGWVCRGWGWACQYINAIDVITADGDELHCNKDVNQDLFWAARGAGPGFPAVVTRFHLNTKELPSHCRSSVYVYPKSKFKSVMSWITTLASSYDTDTEIVCVGRFLPEYEDSIVLVGLTTFKWSEADALVALQVAEDSKPAGYIRANFNRPTTLQREYDNQSAANPNGHRYCCDNIHVKNDADVAGVLEEAFTTLPNRKSFALWYSMSPTSQRQLPDMALSLHSDHYFALYTIWEDKNDDEKFQSWTHEIMRKMENYSVGQYLGDSDFQVRNTMYWSEDNGKKLMQIREKWDPTGRICGYLTEGDQSGAKGIKNSL